MRRFRAAPAASLACAVLLVGGGYGSHDANPVPPGPSDLPAAPDASTPPVPVPGPTPGPLPEPPPLPRAEVPDLVRGSLTDEGCDLRGSRSRCVLVPDDEPRFVDLCGASDGAESFLMIDSPRLPENGGSTLLIGEKSDVSSMLCHHGGRHLNARLPSRALYLSAVGTDAAVAASGVCSTELDVHPAGQRKLAYIWATSLVLLEVHTTLEDLASNVIAACRLLSGTGNVLRGATSPIVIEDCSAIRNAFAAVGIAVADQDYDDVIDTVDNCPEDPNPDQDPAVCVGTPTPPPGDFPRHYGGTATIVRTMAQEWTSNDVRCEGTPDADLFVTEDGSVSLDLVFPVEARTAWTPRSALPSRAAPDRWSGAAPTPPARSPFQSTSTARAARSRGPMATPPPRATTCSSGPARSPASRRAN